MFIGIFFDKSERGNVAGFIIVNNGFNTTFSSR